MARGSFDFGIEFVGRGYEHYFMNVCADFVA